MKKEILTVKKLKELIASGNQDKIKMITKMWDDDNGKYHTYDTKINLKNPFKLEEGDDKMGNYINIKWSTSEGDPNICLMDENCEINNKCDMAGDYYYTLYIEN